MKTYIRKYIVGLLLAVGGILPCNATDFFKNVINYIENCEYNNRDWGVRVGYINRKFRYTANHQTWAADPYGYSDKAEHGFMMGFRYTPYFGHCQGLVTGFDVRALFQSPDYDVYGTDCLTSEVGVYIPVMYRLTVPVYDNVSCFFQLGLGMYMGFVRNLDLLTGDDDDSINVGFGRSDDFVQPNRFQFSVPVGFGATYKNLTLEATYNAGLNNNGSWFSGKSKESLWEAAISIGF